MTKTDKQIIEEFRDEFIDFYTNQVKAETYAFNLEQFILAATAKTRAATTVW